MYDNNQGLINNENVDVRIEHKFGCKLVGMIPCSDAFGVDLIIERYEESINERAASKKEDADKRSELRMEKIN